jgi:hypothetical protein
MTPTDLPIIKRKFKPSKSQISTIPEHTTDSRYTSTRSEDLREVRALFNASNGVEPASSAAQDETACDSSTVSSKHSKIASFFRRRLSRTFSKSKLDKPDLEKLREAKIEIKSNLLNDQGPDAGGYDADASELNNVDDDLASKRNTAEEVEPDRGRKKGRRHTVTHSTWSGPR